MDAERVREEMKDESEEKLDAEDVEEVEDLSKDKIDAGRSYKKRWRIRGRENGY